jgi:hypothetical protein
VLDHLEKKVEGSKKKQRRRRARKGTWDEVNGTGKEERRNTVLRNTGIDVDDNEWEDDDGANAATTPNDGVEVLVSTTETKLAITYRPISMEEADEEDKIT